MFSKTFFVIVALAVGAFAVPGAPATNANPATNAKPATNANPAADTAKGSTNAQDPSAISAKCSASEYCCSSLQNSNSGQGAEIAKNIGISTDTVVPLGLSCKPITAIDIADKKCLEKPLCCKNYYDDSLVGVDCALID